MTSLHVRRYGDAGPLVVVLHGGPGAAGSMAPVARKLADSFRVIEPFQRGSGGPPLEVADHIADLHQLIDVTTNAPPPALVGHSWGAMLALAFAAARPESAGPIVLIGCGTFDQRSRARFREVVEERMTPHYRMRLDRIQRDITDPDEALCARGELMEELYAHNLIEAPREPMECDARAHDETWNDMLRLQNEGVYPAAFTAIRSPVIMLHGAVDPHPGRMIFENLVSYIPHLEYREWADCGHSPWLEQAARDDFFATLITWLSRRAPSHTPIP